MFYFLKIETRKNVSCIFKLAFLIGRFVLRRQILDGEIVFVGFDRKFHFIILFNIFDTIGILFLFDIYVLVHILYSLVSHRDILGSVSYLGTCNSLQCSINLIYNRYRERNPCCNNCRSVALLPHSSLLCCYHISHTFCLYFPLSIGLFEFLGAVHSHETFRRIIVSFKRGCCKPVAEGG